MSDLSAQSMSVFQPGNDADHFGGFVVHFAPGASVVHAVGNDIQRSVHQHKRILKVLCQFIVAVVSHLPLAAVGCMFSLVNARVNGGCA